MDHGSCLTTGYRFGDLSYCVDMKRLDHKALDILQGSKIWIVDAAGFNNPNHDVHADLETVYKYNEQIKAETVYITSLSTQMDYKTLQAELPEGFAPAHDGLVIHRP
jgi:phosphoribosyl 1,2-cyclic phosphate phosphodiesterase